MDHFCTEELAVLWSLKHTIEQMVHKINYDNCATCKHGEYTGNQEQHECIQKSMLIENHDEIIWEQAIDLLVKDKSKLDKCKSYIAICCRELKLDRETCQYYLCNIINDFNIKQRLSFEFKNTNIEENCEIFMNALMKY